MHLAGSPVMARRRGLVVREPDFLPGRPRVLERAVRSQLLFLRQVGHLHLAGQSLARHRSCLTRPTRLCRPCRWLLRHTQQSPRHSFLIGRRHFPPPVDRLGQVPSGADDISGSERHRPLSLVGTGLMEWSRPSVSQLSEFTSRVVSSADPLGGKHRLDGYREQLRPVEKAPFVRLRRMGVQWFECRPRRSARVRGGFPVRATRSDPGPSLKNLSRSFQRARSEDDTDTAPSAERPTPPKRCHRKCGRPMPPRRALRSALVEPRGRQGAHHGPAIDFRHKAWC